MAVIKFIAPVLAAVGFAAAQSSCSNSATTTLQNGGDATALASCRTFTGSIALATGITGDFSLNGIQTIEGDLIADNVTQLTSFSADSLTTISGTFSLTSMIRMSGLVFPRLSIVDTIDWSALPNLQGLTFATGVRMAKRVTIQNTQLGTLDGINLYEVDLLNLANNRFLNRVSMPLGNVSDQLVINSNGRTVEAEFPNLIWAQNMTVNNVSSLSVPSLKVVNGSFGMNFNYFTNFSAPNLTNVGGSFSAVSNGRLTDLSCPVLTEVDGGLQVANNSALMSVTGFPDLQTVGGALDVSGVFNNISFPALSDVKGAFNVQTTQNVDSECNGFKSIAGPDLAIKGPFTCTTTSNPSSADGTTGSSPEKTSTGAASAVTITGATGLLGVVAAIFGLL